MSTVKVMPTTPTGAPTQFQALITGATYTAGNDGGMTVDSRDVPELERGGFTVVTDLTVQWNSPTPPAAANVAFILASGALSNGTQTIAAQPETPRPMQYLVFPGSPAITAGTLTLTYAANDGTAAQVDVLSLVTPASTTLTLNSSKAVAKLASQVVAGLVGGGSPTIEGGTTAVLGVPIMPNSQDVAILSETLDTGGVSIANAGAVTNAGLYTPHTAPNGTHTYSVTYTMQAW